jgi:hypothetical protein
MKMVECLMTNKKTGEICGKEFNGTTGLYHHQNVVHKRIRVICPLCGRKWI